MKDASDESPEWQQLAEWFEAAQALPPAERDALVASAPLSDAMRQELTSLLAHAPRAEQFFGALRHAVSEAAPGVSINPPNADLPPTLVGCDVAHYHITAELGRGGMGVVYRATDVRLQRTVALKLLHTRAASNGLSTTASTIESTVESIAAMNSAASNAAAADAIAADAIAADARVKAKLLAEARASASLDHPNICTVYEVGETDDHVPYIAMAYYAGETLEERLKRGPLPITTAVDFAAQIAGGLAAAHERGIVHRDVKPANVLITEQGVIKLLDFGIARDLSGGSPRTTPRGFTPGTISYMSPEQVSGLAVDQRTDLWSLGVVLHEMCAGVRPFTTRNVGGMLYDIVYTAAPTLNTVRDDVPPHVQRIVSRLLEKDAAQRYASAREVLHDLTQWPTGEAPAQPETPAAPLLHGRMHRRNRWRVALFAGALVGAVLLALSWQNRTMSSAALARSAGRVARSPSRVAAQDLYNQGHRDVLFRTEIGRREALQYFQQAIATDSTFATAHAGLAHLLVLMSDNAGNERPGQLTQAEREARTAIHLDSLDADAHAALGHVLLYDYRFADAEAAFLRAIALNPRTPYVREFLVWLHIFTGDNRKALAEAERGALEHPTSPTALAEQARALLVNGRCNEAWPILNRLLLLKPPPARVPSIAAQCHAMQREWPQAVALMRPVAASSPLQGMPWLAYFLAQSGDTTGARVVRDSLLAQWRAGSAGAYGVAVAWAGLGERDSTFVWLDRAVRDRSLRYNIMEPVFAELRQDARFAQLMAQMGAR